MNSLLILRVGYRDVTRGRYPYGVVYSGVAFFLSFQLYHNRYYNSSLMWRPSFFFGGRVRRPTNLAINFRLFDLASRMTDHNGRSLAISENTTLSFIETPPFPNKDAFRSNYLASKSLPNSSSPKTSCRCRYQGEVIRTIVLL